jgi:hypothetical protein
MRDGAVSSSGLTTLRCGTHKLFCSRMIEVSLFLSQFQALGPPPPNPPPLTDEEEEATTYRVCNPPLCKCRYHSELANPPIGLDYTPFWRCPISLSVIVYKSCLSFVVMKVLILCT